MERNAPPDPAQRLAISVGQVRANGMVAHGATVAGLPATGAGHRGGAVLLRHVKSHIHDRCMTRRQAATYP
jgi:hypothetical protein